MFYLTISKLDDGTYVYKNHPSATAGKPQIDPKILQQAEDKELKINERWDTDLSPGIFISPFKFVVFCDLIKIIWV